MGGQPSESLYSTRIPRTGIKNYLTLKWRPQTFSKQKTYKLNDEEKIPVKELARQGGLATHKNFTN